jgi:uncharacterized protein
MFIGRKEELSELKRIEELEKASLVVVRGRRRIGKSTLIEVFAEHYPKFIEIQGLAPRDKISNAGQLTNFCTRMSSQLQLPEIQFKNWNDSFEFLAKQIGQNKTLLFLDEISWMAQYDKDFVGHFKIAWDLYFKKCNQLMLVLCGSVSSWIDQNILNSTGLMGRVSLSLQLKELSLPLCNQFWKTKKVSSREKLKILAITGGVPRLMALP